MKKTNINSRESSQPIHSPNNNGQISEYLTKTLLHYPIVNTPISPLLMYVYLSLYFDVTASMEELCITELSNKQLKKK